MRRVHYLENSRAHRILWLLEELGLDYEVSVYPRSRTMQAPKELREKHPLGKSPILEDEGKALAESGAITEYLAGRYGGGALRPTEGEAGLRCTYWLHYAEGSAMPLLFAKLLFQVMPKGAPALIRPVARMIANGADKAVFGPQLRVHADFWEKELARDGYFAGPDFTVADIMMSFPVEAGIDRIPLSPPPPALSAWLDAIRARPAYRRALERGGAYAFADTGKG